mmetsp:Transcript_21665/g.43974  ORF Transcript_21665/g.43974 Transcript_21665/m.43974 type:complete len:220 (-) Transcript_21665:574-1233(-)
MVGWMGCQARQTTWTPKGTRRRDVGDASSKSPIPRRSDSVPPPIPISSSWCFFAALGVTGSLLLYPWSKSQGQIIVGIGMDVWDGAVTFDDCVCIVYTVVVFIILKSEVGDPQPFGFFFSEGVPLRVVAAVVVVLVVAVIAVGTGFRTVVGKGSWRVVLLPIRFFVSIRISTSTAGVKTFLQFGDFSKNDGMFWHRWGVLRVGSSSVSNNSSSSRGSDT